MAIALLHHFQRLAKSATARQQQLMRRQAIVKSATAQLAGVPNASGDLGRVEHYCAAMLDSEAILSAISVQNLRARLTEPTHQLAAARARPMIMHLVEQQLLASNCIIAGVIGLRARDPTRPKSSVCCRNGRRASHRPAWLSAIQRNDGSIFP